MARQSLIDQSGLLKGNLQHISTGLPAAANFQRAGPVRQRFHRPKGLMSKLKSAAISCRQLFFDAAFGQVTRLTFGLLPTDFKL